MTAITQLKITDFQKIDYPFGYEHTLSLWGTACKVVISPVDNKDVDLSVLLSQIKEYLLQINDTQKECFQSILDANMVKLAEEWITDGAFKVESEVRECYLTDEGVKVFIPLTQQEFLQSINLQSINFIFFEGNENPLVELYLECNPNYFFGHIIICQFENSNPILYKCCGLEG